MQLSWKVALTLVYTFVLICIKKNNLVGRGALATSYPLPLDPPLKTSSHTGTSSCTTELTTGISVKIALRIIIMFTEIAVTLCI